MRILYLLLLIFMLSISASHAGIVSSTFDTGLDGWTIEGRNYDGDSKVSNGGTLSNPGGYLQASDTPGNNWMFAIAPDKYRTDWGTHSVISADIMGDEHPWNYTAAFFILNGDNKWKHEFDINAVEHNNWRTLTVTLEETNWSQVAGTQAWDTTLSNVTDFWIRVDLSSFSDTVHSEFNGIDNVALAPEPVSSTLFAIGGITLGLRLYRKKRSNV